MKRLGDALEHSLDQVINDDVLRLIFTACHPVLAVEGRIALTLRLIFYSCTRMKWRSEKPMKSLHPRK